jgi:thimet oligopeptidase
MQGYFRIYYKPLIIMNMRNTRFWALMSILLFVVACAQSPNKDQNETTSENPLFNTFNQPVDFAALTAEDIREAVTAIQRISNATIAEIVKIEEGDRTFENTMRAYDQMLSEFVSISSPIYLMAYTHPDSAIRNSAMESNTELSQYGNEISLNEDLYKAIKTYGYSEEAKQLAGHKDKFVSESIADFERNGFALIKEDRDLLKSINDELAEISDQFSKNIAEDDQFLIVKQGDMDGLPEDYRAARKQEDLSYPSYLPFMKYSKSESARKALYLKYQNRAAPENLAVLKQLLQKRLEMAKRLGYQSYSAYRLADRMAKNPQTVWAFETKLKEDLKVKTALDLQELQAIKASHGGGLDLMKSWESSFYSNILLNEKYQLDAEKVKEYFALEDVIEGLFSITQTLFDLEYKEVLNPSVWQKDVRMFEVYQEGKLKGIFYLDLHPRANKYNHAACFGMINGRMTPNGYQIPMATLVCNFPEATPDKPALMPHSQVETFFHEFGHVLHQMMTTSEIYAQSGTNVARDFVEAPSQIFENWVWNYDAVKLFAKHYQTREVMPEALFNKMLAAKNVGSGIAASSQVFYGTYDLTLHDKFDPNTDQTTTDVLREVQNDILPLPYVEGTHFQAAFGHLDGYGSSYYGYLWSLVYAQDMFSLFDENGILDKKTGLRYRDIILAKGSSEDALALVAEFLGRAPNNKAFLKELGL